MRWQWVLAAVVALSLVGCAKPAAPPRVWESVDLPQGTRAVSLATAGDSILVGGAAEAAPSLLQVAGGRIVAELALDPQDPYAAASELTSITVAGDEIYALGKAVGGAHSNARMSVWDGSLKERALVSRPQDFFTFGGHDAGGLLGTVVVAGEPVIVGSRTTVTGSAGRLWRRTGTTWSEHQVPSLTSTPDRTLGFVATAAAGEQILLVGDELGLAGGLTQVPLSFIGTPDRAWPGTVLPVPEGPAEAGQLARATGVACRDDGSTCWVSGWAKGQPLVWSLDLTGTEVRSSAPAVLSGRPPQEAAPLSLVALIADRPAVLTNAAEPRLAVGCGQQWRESPAPPGTVSALAGTPTELYAVAKGALWRVAAPGC